MWNTFGAPLGICNQTNWSVKRILRKWWSARAKNSIHKMTLPIVPILILWEIWKQRCSCKYSTQKMFWCRGMENNIWWNLKMAIKLAFPTFDMADSGRNFSERVEQLRHNTEWKMVKWIQPTPGKVKLNTDGCFSNNGAGIGGIVRNEDGNMIMAFAAKVDCNSNNKAEAEATKYGIQ